MMIGNGHPEKENIELWTIVTPEQIVGTTKLHKRERFNEQFIRSLVILRHQLIGFV